MIEQLQVPAGCCVIPLWRNVSRDNLHPIYEIIDYTIIDEIDFDWLNQYRWLMQENRNGDRYAVRVEWIGKKRTHIFMSREILDLPRGAGCSGDIADHIEHNTLNNRRNNLRKATPSQSIANTRRNSNQRFRGVSPEGSKYEARIKINRSPIYFTTVIQEVEAGLMYNYAAYLLFEEFAELNIIPEDEMPSPDRQWELYDMVVAKLRQEGFPCVDALNRDGFDLCV